MKLLIYADAITPRIDYTMQLVFGEIARISYQITQNIDTWQQYEGVKIAYAKPEKSIKNITLPFAHFVAADLLYEKNIQPQKIQLNKQQQITFEQPHQAIFDPFAAIFWCVSRYEEYLPFQPDKYGRFEANQSFLYQNNLLQKAVVNEYAHYIEQRIQQVFHHFTFQKKSFQIETTLDIDSAFAYLHKGLTRTLLGIAGNLYYRQWSELKQRFLTYLHFTPDKYNSYDWLDGVHQKYDVKPIYFFLLGDYAAYDKNLSHKSPHLQQLICRLAQNAEIGIHPSFASNEKPEKVSIEKLRLEKITQKTITKSRQHYLRLKLPSTYRQLIAAGITDDYSMGYGSEIGFRAGICMPFTWYDLLAEQATSLTVHPFAIMDATLHYYLQLSASQVPSYTQNVIQEVKKYGGILSLLFHNESVGNQAEWKNWQEVYEYFLDNKP
jgi:hypothetical protein